MHRSFSETSGFTMIELLVACTLLVIMSIIAVPLMQNASNMIKLGQAAREVERELQTARLMAVSANQPIRLRFDCPAAGEYRMVELVGTPSVPVAADSAANRCGLNTYPYPTADNNPLTRPNHDGPLRKLDSSVTFTTVQTIEFWPDGTAHTNTGGVNPWPTIASAGTNLILTRQGKTRTINVNGVGKIQLQ
jgi:type II secretory pathway pseudopilin PulG